MEQKQRSLTSRELSQRTGKSLPTLKRWRQLRQGPEPKKLGIWPQSGVSYPIENVEAWERDPKSYQWSNEDG